ncbi:hypothetical protein PHY01_04730 [Pseudonocardia hydrocarbonoxydans]|uniref:DUF4126 domain-containing protein n=1 Tax=Pseudonocardia hydrocarbonoxydans TaxID=76726 RepID=A0A4Y3WJJ8_9PSEU|nr:hypothetical protein [Pseudonocardia hydrocarbonoxydans]GEC18190.1 hypothetical protein PHY01_04730 [Pseudonocardia hydrocarbonoxydans]
MTPSPWSGLLRGVAAGAAGTTALNAVTTLDVAVRGRPTSDAPEQVVAALADRAGVEVTERRLAALAPLAGAATGVGVGAAAGALRAAGLRLPTAVGGPLLGLAAMVASDGPIALLGVSDPRRWTAQDWVTDAVPHLVYGMTTHAALVAALPDPGPPPRAATLLRAAALGAASGSRSTAGAAAVAFTSSRADRGVAGRAGGRGAGVLAGVLSAGEAVADKLPSTPSRTAPPGLLPRAALGAGSAAAVARRDGDDATLAGVVGLGAALGAAVLGVRTRAAAARRFGSDLPGAVAEDVLAALLGWLGARRR